MFSAVVLLALASGAARAQHPPGLAPGQTYHRIFVTSKTYGISSDDSIPPPFNAVNGLPGADWHVTLGAFNAGLPGMESWNGEDLVYTALLSTADVDAHTHVSIQGPLFNTQNEQVADDGADFWDASLDAAIRYDEFGNTVSTSRVLSGSTPTGNFSGDDCGCRTDSSSEGTYGEAILVGTGWLGLSSQSCSNSARLYGISPPITVPLVGDHNDDGTVDAADHALWRSDPAAYGAAQGYTDWQANFGQSVGAASRAARPPRLGGPTPAVPEPATAALALLAALLFLNRGGRRERGEKHEGFPQPRRGGSV